MVMPAFGKILDARLRQDTAYNFAHPALRIESLRCADDASCTQIL